MREYLFKGKRVDNYEWVDGFYIYDDSGQTTGYPAAYIVHLNKHPCGWSLIPYEVIPETICEYIGVHDKNGKKIFENDIVMYNEEYGEITYHNDEAMFVVEFDTWFTDFDHIYGKELEIIDNVFDNSELLEV
jgi:hypothetical protein